MMRLNTGQAIACRKNISDLEFSPAFHEQDQDCLSHRARSKALVKWIWLGAPMPGYEFQNEKSSDWHHRQFSIPSWFSTYHHSFSLEYELRLPLCPFTRPRVGERRQERGFIPSPSCSRHTPPFYWTQER